MLLRTNPLIMPRDPVRPLLFDRRTIRQVLERMRRAEPLGETPLRRLVWIRQQIESQGLHSSPTGIELALTSTLTDLITQNLQHLRNVEGLSSEVDQTREAGIAALINDFSRTNAELEAWSVLHFRYVRIDLNLQVQDIAYALNTYPKLINRRLSHGCHRLTEHLSKLESDARADNRRLWLTLKLPPQSYTSFIDTENSLPRLLALLDEEPPPHTISLIGPGGIGKTAFAHAAAQHWIDAERITNLAWLTVEAPTSYSSLLLILAHALGYLHSDSVTQADLEASLRERFATSRILVIIDHADHLDPLDEILPRLDVLVAPGRLLLTQRRQPRQGTSLRVMPIGPMPPPAIVTLLRDYAGLRRIHQFEALDNESLHAMMDAIGGNPLAARLVVSHLAFLPLPRVLEQLPMLPVPGGEPLFDRLYRQAWDALNLPAQQVLLALSLTSAEGFDWRDLQRVTKFAPTILDEALRHLVEATLVEVFDTPPRYLLHPLTRRFAREQAHQPEWHRQNREMLQRAIDIICEEASILDAVPTEIAAKAVNLLRNQLQLGESPEAITTTVMRIAPAARRSGQWVEWRLILREIVAHLPAKQPQRAHAMLELGIAARWLGDEEEALAAFDAAIDLMGQHGNFTAQAEASIEKGHLHEALGQTALAYETYQRAASVGLRYRIPGIRRHALNRLAGLALHNSDPNTALTLLEMALETLDDGDVDGSVMSQLGVTLVELGRIEEAIAAHQQALDALRDEGDLPRLARAYLRIGIALHAVGRLADAQESLETGLNLMRTLGDAFGQARLMNNLGTVYADSALWVDALSMWHDALMLQSYLNDPIGMASTLYNIADLEWRLNHPKEARAHLDEARDLAERVNLVALLDRIANHPMNN